MSTTIKLRGGTATNWASVNPVLLEREMVVETDTLKIKIGDGTTAYNSLDYSTAGAPTTNPTGGVNNYAPISSPTFTGHVTIPNPTDATDAATYGILDDRCPAPIVDLFLKGSDDGTSYWSDTATTQATNDVSKKIATTEFVHKNILPITDILSAPSIAGTILTASDDGTATWGNTINSPIVTGLQTFADNVAAAALPTGTIYKTSTGVLMIKY